MKKTILYIFAWLILADFANYTNCKILMIFSCVCGVLIIRDIMKNCTRNE